MVKIKIQKVKNDSLTFKINIKDSELNNYKFLKRALIEGKPIKGNFNYEIPLRYLVPIVNNIHKDNIAIDRYSALEFLEFYDEFEEKYYASLTATPKFMKLWRQEKCPNIFKIKIDPVSLVLTKEIAFKKVKINFESIYKLSFEKFKIMYLLENVDETNIKSAIIDTIESIEISLHTNTIRHSSHEITNLISIWELEVNIDFQKYLKNLIRHY